MLWPCPSLLLPFKATDSFQIPNSERVHHGTTSRARIRGRDSSAIAAARASFRQESRLAAGAPAVRRSGHAGPRISQHFPRQRGNVVPYVGQRHPRARHRNRVLTARGRPEHLLCVARTRHWRHCPYIFGRIPAEARGQHQLLHHHDGVYPLGAAARACGRHRAPLHRLGARLDRVLHAHRPLRLRRRGRLLPHAHPDLLRRADAAGGPGGRLRRGRNDAAQRSARVAGLGAVAGADHHGGAAHRLLRLHQGRAIPLPLLAA